MTANAYRNGYLWGEDDRRTGNLYDPDWTFQFEQMDERLWPEWKEGYGDGYYNSVPERTVK